VPIRDERSRIIRGLSQVQVLHGTSGKPHHFSRLFYPPG